MISLLTNPLCGWPPNRLYHLPNVSAPGDLPKRLIEEFEDAKDVALFYYVGHGQMADGQLCLSLEYSETEAKRRAVSSLPFEAVRNALDCDATTKIVILDCCYSGLASQRSNTLAAFTEEVQHATAVAGAYTMAACGANNTAWYQTDPSLDRPQTFFTKYLADLIEAGMPGYPPALRMHEIFTQLSHNLAQAKPKLPAPTDRNIDAAREFLFAHNGATPEPDADSVLTPPKTDLADSGRNPRKQHVAWWPRRLPALLATGDSLADPLGPPTIGRFLPNPVNETAERREIERLVNELPPDRIDEAGGYSPDHVIDALEAKWVAEVREQYAHYLASVTPVLRAAEANAKRARAREARDRSLLSHKVMALNSALLRMAGHDQGNHRGDDHGASR